MNKADLVAEIAKKVGVSKRTAEKCISCNVDTITKALKKGDTVTLVGFGSYAVAKRSARTGRNPQTGKEIKIPAKKVVKFSPGKALKIAVNKS